MEFELVVAELVHPGRRPRLRSIRGTPVVAIDTESQAMPRADWAALVRRDRVHELLAQVCAELVRPPVRWDGGMFGCEEHGWVWMDEGKVCGDGLNQQGLEPPAHEEWRATHVISFEGDDGKVVRELVMKRPEGSYTRAGWAQRRAGSWDLHPGTVRVEPVVGLYLVEWGDREAVVEARCERAAVAAIRGRVVGLDLDGSPTASRLTGAELSAEVRRRAAGASDQTAVWFRYGLEPVSVDCEADTIPPPEAA